MQRREFLKSAQASGIVLLGLSDAAVGQEGRGPAPAPQNSPALTLRPYQLLCLICSAGEEQPANESEKWTPIRDALRENPDLPITLVCNAGDVYYYQDPGTEDDTPGGRDFNRKRDLDILQILDLEPGCTLPARALLLTLLNQIPSVAGICGYGTATSECWAGCPKAASGNYEKAHAKGIVTLIPPRSEQEMAEEKEKSLRALYAAQDVTVRPHILLCAVCQYGGGTRPPYPADNLPELLELILTKNPDVQITFARQADWMMCAPCPQRVPKLNACVNVLGSGGLSNEKRDLDMLQKLGLQFGSSMKARELFRLILERIPTTKEICGRDNVTPSVWWDPCGESNRTEGHPDYDKGRQLLMTKLGLV